jgi:hypothetical protein
VEVHNCTAMCSSLKTMIMYVCDSDTGGYVNWNEICSSCCLWTVRYIAVSWLRWLVTSVSSQRPGSVHVWFVVRKVAVGQVFLRVLGFPISVIPLWLSILIYNCEWTIGPLVAVVSLHRYYYHHQTNLKYCGGESNRLAQWVGNDHCLSGVLSLLLVRAVFFLQVHYTV